MRTGLAVALLALAGGAVAGPATAGPNPIPACAAGPSRSGDTIVGTPCADLIRVPPEVAVVRGGGGSDVILATGAAADSCPESSCGTGSQTFYGGPGDDLVFGERGNDNLYGEGGDDRLFGGIGDDLLRGGTGNDRLSGGFGFDSIDGESGDDFVRGDGTIDKLIADSGGGADRDTLSYGSGVTPGFPDNNTQFGPYPAFSTEYAGFPPAGGERGVYIDLSRGVADNGVAPSGGGVEAIEGGDFEVVIGTAFSDYIVGDETAETIYGGGGADVLLGEGGADEIYGGAGGDSCDGATTHCETTAKEVAPRDATKISAGVMAPQESGPPGLYLTGSEGNDDVTATYSAESSAVTFELGTGVFDEAPVTSGDCEEPAPAELVCPLAAAPDTIVLAGLSGEDTVAVVGFPRTTSVYALGGEGADTLTGGEATEDVLVDGSGDDELAALGGDDAILNNDGADRLDGGDGNDLFVSNSICDGDTLDGGAQRDNASWAKFGESAIEARIGAGLAGRPGDGSEPDCTGGSLDALLAVEDLEGSREGDDVLYGGAGDNQLFGRSGADVYHALGGEDRILANSGDTDQVIDCGADADVAFVDLPPPEGPGDPAPIDCETVYESAPNDFQAPEPPSAPPEGSPPGDSGSAQAPSTAASPGDTRAPRTTIARHPRRRVASRRQWRRVSFAFAGDEPGVVFRCRMDRRRFRRCRSPRAYRVRWGRHVFRVFAVDAAGNRDRSPAVFRFLVKRLSARSSRSHRRRARSRLAPRPRRARAARPARRPAGRSDLPVRP